MVSTQWMEWAKWKNKQNMTYLVDSYTNMYIAGVYKILYTTTACTNTAKTVSCAKNGGWRRSKIHLILHGFKVQWSVSNKRSRENSSFWWRSTTQQWSLYVQQVIDEYNNSYHSTIRQKSIDALRVCWSTDMKRQIPAFDFWKIKHIWYWEGVGLVEIMGSRLQRCPSFYIHLTQELDGHTPSDEQIIMSWEFLNRDIVKNLSSTVHNSLEDLQALRSSVINYV